MKMKIYAEGRFRVQVMRGDGSVRVDHKQRNLITNYGMDYMIGKYRDVSGTNLMQWLRIGTGTTTPANADVALANQIATIYAGTQTNTNPVATSQTPYMAVSRVYTGARGAVVGNLTELGLSWSQTGNNLATRALFLDTNGQPVTIVVAADEQLIVTYEMRIYIPTAATSSSVTDPTTGVAYTIRALPVNAVNWNWIDYVLGGQLGTSGGLANLPTYAYYGSNAAIREWHNTPVGTETTGGVDYNNVAVTDGTYAREAVLTLRLDAFNNLDIKVLRTTEASPSYFAPLSWQFEFTPTFRKTADQTITLTVRLELARR